jgi:hypothetical protein
MIRRRSQSVMLVQRAISSSDRLQPVHKPVSASIMQTLMQGESISFGCVKGKNAHGGAPPLLPWAM